MESDGAKDKIYMIDFGVYSVREVICRRSGYTKSDLDSHLIIG